MHSNVDCLQSMLCPSCTSSWYTVCRALSTLTLSECEVVKGESFRIEYKDED
jgi:hypothetical protein